MTGIVWSREAQGDLERLYAFLAGKNPHAARRVIVALAAAPRYLAETPRLGERLDEFAPREVRRIFVGDYELRYEVTPGGLAALRLWHMREQRP